MTLEVNGVPDTSCNRKYPWPKPKFIAVPARSDPLRFDISLFSNGEVDFLIPEALYIWRIAGLEQMIRQKRRIDGLLIHTYFDESEGKDDEDNALVPYPAEIMYAEKCSESEFHFQNSGYNVIKVRFSHNDLYESMCVWEISPATGRYSGPRPHTLDRDQKAAIHKIIDDLESDTDIQTYFSRPVDLCRYVDYLNMIEVPMDFSFIRKRLKNDYYSNLLSVSADVRLIRDNCFKYNESDSAISIAARQMFDQFSNRFEDVLKFDIGQREPSIDRHIPLIPDEDEDVDILFDQAIESSEHLLPESIAEPNLPRRRSARFASDQSSAEPLRIGIATESNSIVRRGAPSRSDIRLVNLRQGTRSNRAIQRHQTDEAHTLPNTRSTVLHSHDQNTTVQNSRPERSSHLDNMRETRSSGTNRRNLRNEARSNSRSSINVPPGRRSDSHFHSSDAVGLNSRIVHSCDSANIRETRSNNSLQRDLHAASQSSSMNHSPSSDHVPSGRRLRSLTTGTVNNVRASVWENDRGLSNNATVIRIRISPTSRRISSRINDSPQASALHNVSPTPNTLRLRRRDISRVSGDESPSVLTKFLRGPNSTIEDAPPRRQTRTSTTKFFSSALPVDVPPSNMMSKRTSRRIDHEKVNSKRENISDLKYPSKKTSASEEKTDDSTTDEESSELLKKKSNKPRKKKQDDNDASYDSHEDEDDFHTTRRFTRKSARKVASYKEDTDEYDDETEDSDNDEGMQRKSTRNRARKRGRVH